MLAKKTANLSQRSTMAKVVYAFCVVNGFSALALCNGVCNLIASWFFLRSEDAWALPFALAAGILMVMWDVYEFIFLPNPLAIVFGIIGVVQAVMSFLVIRRFDSRKGLFA